ncbi:MAG: LptF/LptG family permease [Kiritimatiellae bacterium]|jgi:lipopolysaccharide export system permease protein|nr:LptF/LptG family permease [Kiritimatiellia bacterium]
MKIIERYVLKSFLTAVFLSWLVLSFVMSISLLVKIVQLMIQGLPVKVVGLFMLVGFPETLRLTIPVSLLVSSLLVFGRLSADSEIAAMRSCGVNLLAIIKWPIIFAFVCTAFGVYINNEVVPRAHYIRRNIQSEISVEAGIDLLEPGKFITDFPDITIWFASKDGNWIHDVLIFDHSHEGVTREVRAEKTLVETRGEDVVLSMYKVRIDPIEYDRPGIATADRFTHVIKDALKKNVHLKKEKDLNYKEIVARIKHIHINKHGLPPKELAKVFSVYRTNFHMRFVYASAAFIFVLIGVPLGLRSHRKESTIGIALSLVIALAFYLGVIFAETMDRSPAFYPHLLVWIPFVLCSVIALYLLPRNL